MMKYLIRTFMGIGFVAVLFGAGAMDSNTIIAPILITILGIGMFALGGYLDSYYEWRESRNI